MQAETTHPVRWEVAGLRAVVVWAGLGGRGEELWCGLLLRWWAGELYGESPAWLACRNAGSDEGAVLQGECGRRQSRLHVRVDPDRALAAARAHSTVVPLLM